MKARCPFCGDSENPNHRHLSIDPAKGLYYCFRCGVGGKLPVEVLGQIDVTEFLDKNTPKGTLEVKDLEIHRGPGLSRKSILSRYHELTRQADAFPMYHTGSTEPVGWYLRDQKGQSRVIGEQGISWSGAPHIPLTSTSDDPLRLVEGPYDALGLRDVCFFGFYRLKSLRLLSSQFVIFMPDGDTWVNPHLYGTLTRRVMQSEPFLSIQGILIIPNKRDPDEANSELAHLITLDQFKESNPWIKQSSSLKARQVRASLL